jgi:hypothetical protein
MAAGAARADVDGDVRAGYYTDAEAFSIGGGLLTNLDSGRRWFFNPNLELAFADGGSDLYSVNGDVHYDFAGASGVSFYAGGGPAVLIVNPDAGDSDTDFGLNLIGGVAGVRGPLRPFGQIKGVLSDNGELALMGGIRF